MEYISETNEIVIRKDDYLRLGPNGFYKYIGQVKTIHEVPNSNCLYSMDGLLYNPSVALSWKLTKPPQQPLQATKCHGEKL